MVDALERAQSDEDVRAVLLTGTGMDFCSGFDHDHDRARPVGTRLPDMDLIELNEVFAGWELALLRKWKFTETDHECPNVRGSGISLGHPVGATGAHARCPGARAARP